MPDPETALVEVGLAIRLVGRNAEHAEDGLVFYQNQALLQAQMHMQQHI